MFGMVRYQIVLEEVKRKYEIMTYKIRCHICQIQMIEYHVTTHMSRHLDVQLCILACMAALNIFVSPETMFLA